MANNFALLCFALLDNTMYNRLFRLRVYKKYYLLTDSRAIRYYDRLNAQNCVVEGFRWASEEASSSSAQRKSCLVTFDPVLSWFIVGVALRPSFPSVDNVDRDIRS